MQIPQIYINLDYFVQLGQLPMPLLIWRLMLDGGWIIVLVIGFRIASELWLRWRQGKYVSGQRYVLLAISVPKMNEQSLKAMEHIFSTMASTFIPTDFRDTYWMGIVQNQYSFEIVSIEGYVQFLMRIPVQTRNTLEAAIFSQYPDAEIIEVEDYVNKIPSTYPHREYDAFGLEFILKKPSAFPIRTYVEYEHSLSEEYFKDPMGGLLEVMSSAKKGEQLWMQITAVPNDGGWQKKSQQTVDEILGKKSNKPSSNALVDGLMEWPKLFVQQIAGVTFGDSAPKKEEKPTNKLVEMTSHERKRIDAMQLKASKQGMNCKIRVVYVAKKEVYSKLKLIGGIGSSLGVLTSLDLNGIRWYTKVMPKATYSWQKPREIRMKNTIVRNYKSRSPYAGATSFVLNTEELATIYHFPYRFSKTPSVKKTEAKRAEPPAGLPTTEAGPADPFRPIGSKPASPPPNIPLVQDEDEEGEE